MNAISSSRLKPLEDGGPASMDTGEPKAPSLMALPA